MPVSKVEELLELLDYIRRRAPVTPDHITEARLSGLREVSGRRGIHRNTVANSYIRSLGIGGTAAFETLVAQWLFQGSDSLEQQIKKRSGSGNHAVIRDFFAGKS